MRTEISIGVSAHLSLEGGHSSFLLLSVYIPFIALGAFLPIEPGWLSPNFIFEAYTMIFFPEPMLLFGDFYEWFNAGANVDLIFFFTYLFAALTTVLIYFFCYLFALKRSKKQESKNKQ